MKNLLFLILAFFLLISATPTRVRVADRAEYQKYLKWCNEIVPTTAIQDGKLKVMLVNGQYTDSPGNFKPIEPRTVYWYPIGTKRVICEKNEVLIWRHQTVWKKRRVSSVRDFYEWWLPLYVQGSDR